MATSIVLPKLSSDATLPTRLYVGVKTLLILKDDPGNPEAGALINDCFDRDAYARLVCRLQESRAGRAMLQERPSLRVGDQDLGALSHLPEGTLGCALARYYTTNDIRPFDTTQTIEDDIDYISKRYRETHDIYHIVTGYGTDVMGEMELQAFAMANLGIRSPRLIVPFGFVGANLPGDFIGAAETPTRVSAWTYFRRVWRAYRRGASAPPLIGVRFEECWEIPIAVLRQRLIDTPRAGGITGSV